MSISIYVLFNLKLIPSTGVGFSYADDSNDYVTNDQQTADDNYNFLLGFFEQFPSFRRGFLHFRNGLISQQKTSSLLQENHMLDISNAFRSFIHTKNSHFDT